MENAPPQGKAMGWRFVAPQHGDLEMLAKPPSLTEYLGKKMSEICTRSVSTKVDENQCAHFVSHVMEYDGFAITCKNVSDADKLLPGKGAAIRVNEIFNVAETGPWNERPLHLASCLIFVTNSGNMKKNGQMNSGKAKHIGIYIDDVVWHYSSVGKVEKDSVTLFINKIRHSRGYIVAGQTVDFFYGRFLK